MRVASSLVAPVSLNAYERLVSLFDAHFVTKMSVFAERYNFNRAEQRPCEDLAEWVARVRMLTRYCKCKNEVDMLRNRFVLGLHDVKERERLFTEDAGKLIFVAAMELVQSVQCARAASRRAAAGNSGGSSSVGGVFSLKTETRGQGTRYATEERVERRRTMHGRCPRRAVKYSQCSIFRV
ncbi:hypothetical protein EVAR_90981_1 [Eumeta japonica]|uniref:Uncharacterized protein n=1 Tax=Eumeta variegata TaxID=151549 RepID=A0A4C1Z182_EUMVA|nr:hypothetical protein EVAR_90981_1 [Eumeta japonica]